MHRSLRSARDQAQKSVRGFFTMKTLHKRLPVTSWLPKYNLECLEGDLMAGFTVGLTVIPQGIAYAGVGGLPPNYGLYSAFMGCFVYMFLGSCKDITIGPTAIMSIMTHEYSVPGNPDFAVLLCFLSGVIIFASGLCNLGFLITFISKPVIVGFTSAAAINIASSQLGGLFGFKVEGEGIVSVFSDFFHHIGETRWQDITLGLVSMVCLLSMRKLKDLKVVKVRLEDPLGTRAWKKAVFLSSVGRNAIIVILATILAAALNNPDDPDDNPFTLTGYVEPGLPKFKPPPFSTNGTNGTYLDFSDMMTQVGSGIVVIPLISILESIAIASAFSGGKTIDATQEMFALGVCNVLGSFVSSMPVTGSFSRTAVNSTSGVKTTAGGVVTGLLVVLALAFLTPYFKFIPKSALAAVIICAVIFMVEYDMVLPIWHARHIDQLPLWGTFITCLFWKLEFGIVVGVCINLAILLYGQARPKVEVHTVMKHESDEPNYLVVEPRSGLFFPSVDHVRARVNKAALTRTDGSMMVVMDCSHMAGVDYTAVKGIKSLCSDFERRHQPLVFTHVSPGVATGLSSLNENIVIANSQDELHNLLKKAFTVGPDASDGARDRSAGQHYNDPEASNPLLTPAGPAPVIVSSQSV